MLSPSPDSSPIFVLSNTGAPPSDPSAAFAAGGPVNVFVNRRPTAEAADLDELLAAHAQQPWAAEITTGSPDYHLRPDGSIERGIPAVRHTQSFLLERTLAFIDGEAQHTLDICFGAQARAVVLALLATALKVGEALANLKNPDLVDELLRSHNFAELNPLLQAEKTELGVLPQQPTREEGFLEGIDRFIHVNRQVISLERMETIAARLKAIGLEISMLAKRSIEVRGRIEKTDVLTAFDIQHRENPHAGSLVGVQFHPEHRGDAMAKILGRVILADDAPHAEYLGGWPRETVVHRINEMAGNIDHGALLMERFHARRRALNASQAA